MTKILFFCLILMASMLSTIRDSCALMDTAKITVHVVDESGNPVEGAEVGVGFGENSQRKERPVDGFTKTDGRFSASEACNSFVGFRVKKPGYYMSSGHYVFDYGKKGLLRWEPWNPEIKVVLRNVENPVPMYARDTRESPIEIPVLGKDVGFDLIAFDWVKPYGRGGHSDFMFNLKVMDNGGNDFEYQLSVKFTNKFDGIQAYEDINTSRSMLLLPKNAPLDGYKKELGVFLRGVKRGAGYSWKKDRNYIFRVRSEVENGKLKKAMYGKILADIALANPRKKGGFPSIQFKYYLNPTYTNNLEFDPNRNLYTDLKSFERVGL